jgi:hypothetical protein
MRILYSAMILLFVAIPVCRGQSFVDGDTLYVRGKAVVFFGPSQSEYLTMTDQEKDAIDEELYDFYYYRKKVLPFFASNGIQEFSTARRQIEIQLDNSESISYFRKNFGRRMGVILTDGLQAPKIVLGAVSKTELIFLIEEYFGL